MGGAVCALRGADQPRLERASRGRTPPAAGVPCTREAQGRGSAHARLAALRRRRAREALSAPGAADGAGRRRPAEGRGAVLREHGPGARVLALGPSAALAGGGRGRPLPEPMAGAL